MIEHGLSLGQEHDRGGDLQARKGAACRYAKRYAIQYNFTIKTFRHKGLQVFFERGSKAGIQPHPAARLGRQLARLDLANTAADMNVPGWGLHALAGNLTGRYAVSVSGNWRLTFGFDGGDAVLIDYQDYH